MVVTFQTVGLSEAQVIRLWDLQIRIRLEKSHPQMVFPGLQVDLVDQVVYNNFRTNVNFHHGGLLASYRQDWPRFRMENSSAHWTVLLKILQLFGRAGTRHFNAFLEMANKPRSIFSKMQSYSHKTNKSETAQELSRTDLGPRNQSQH